MKKINLNGKWQLQGSSPQGETFEGEAQVPGSALHAVLSSQADGWDVFYRDNAEKVQKYETYSWIYQRSFSLDSLDCRWMLVFEKLDTFCDVYVNDRHVATCENGYIAHRMDISKAAVLGENTVTVYFSSPVLRTFGKKQHRCAFSKDRLYARRPQFTYGWDWAMRFVTCGIGNAFVESVDEGIRVRSAYVATTGLDQDCAELTVDIDFDEFENGGVIDIAVLDPQGRTAARRSRYVEESFSRTVVDIEDPKLWYPNGYGDSPLYTLVISCGERTLYTAPFGIRTVKIMELLDKEGSENHKKCLALKETPFSQEYDKNDEFSGFILKINGKKILCKGANWVPCESFATGNVNQKVTRLLELAADAGINMLRVWGGGDFETEHFYDECSRLGIMVTQDFLMACGKYPEDEAWFLEQLKQEAEFIAHLIRNKACLVWWSGDNENAVKGCDTDVNYKGRASAYKAIAPVIYQKDPHRRFLPSSPYGGSFYASNTQGTTHNTQFLGWLFPYMLRDDVSDYKDVLKLYNARFIAEEPILGATEESCLEKIMTAEDIYGEDLSMWHYHTKTNPALETEIFTCMYRFAQGVLGKFKDGQDRLFKLKYLQYEWLRVSMERVRREQWFCSGIVYWMYNDCWPAAAGWALVDYYGTPKAAYYAFRRGAKPTVLSVDLEEGSYRFHVCNEQREKALSLQWFAVNQEGQIAFSSEPEEIVAKENASFIAAEANQDLVPQDCFVVAQISCQGRVIDRAFYKKGNLEINPCPHRLLSVTAENGAVTVKAKAYVHAVELKGGTAWEDNYFSLLPGEERVVRFEKTAGETVKATGYSI